MLCVILILSVITYHRSFPRAVVHLRCRSERLNGLNKEGVSSHPIKIPSPPKGPYIHKQKSIRPMAGRKNKEGRERAIKDHREVNTLHHNTMTRYEWYVLGFNIWWKSYS